MGGTGQTLAVVPGDQCDQLDLTVREAAEQVAVADDVVAVPVVPGVGQEEADVAQQGRRFEVLPGIVAEPVQLRGPVEEVEGKGGDVLGMLAVLVHELGELHDAAAPDVGEVVQGSAVAALPGVEQHALAQGVVGERHRFETELLEDLLENQGAGEDDVGTPGIQSR